MIKYDDQKAQIKLTKEEKKRQIPLHKVKKEYIKWTEQAFKIWKKHFSIFEEISIMFVSGNYKSVGEYINGSYKTPRFILFLDMIEFDARIDEGETLEANYKITIYHELAHALCEYQRKKKINPLIIKFKPFKREEDFVEKLARCIHYKQTIPLEAILMDHLLCVMNGKKKSAKNNDQKIKKALKS